MIWVKTGDGPDAARVEVVCDCARGVGGPRLLPRGDLGVHVRFHPRDEHAPRVVVPAWRGAGGAGGKRVYTKIKTPNCNQLGRTGRSRACRLGRATRLGFQQGHCSEYSVQKQIRTPWIWDLGFSLVMPAMSKSSRKKYHTHKILPTEGHIWKDSPQIGLDCPARKNRKCIPDRLR